MATKKEIDFGLAAMFVCNGGEATLSFLQRRMNIDYAKANRLMQELEQAGIVGEHNGDSPREVLVKTLPEMHAAIRKHLGV